MNSNHAKHGECLDYNNGVFPVRVARLEDAAAIAAILSEHGEASDQRLATSLWMRRIVDRDILTIIGEADGRPVGFAAAGPEEDGTLLTELELYSIYCSRRFQRQGLGRTLLYALSARTCFWQYKSMGAWVLETNSARGFYEANGARPLHRKKLDSQRDAIAYVWTEWALARTFDSQKARMDQ